MPDWLTRTEYRVRQVTHDVLAALRNGHEPPPPAERPQVERNVEITAFSRLDTEAARLIAEHAAREHQKAVASYRALDAKAVSFTTLAGIVASVSIALLVPLRTAEKAPHYANLIVFLLLGGIACFVAMALVSLFSATIWRLTSLDFRG